MTDRYTDKELSAFDKLEEDCIITLFDTTDKRWAIGKYLRMAYDLGRKVKP